MKRLRNIIPALPEDIGSINKGAYEKNVKPETSRIVREFNLFDELLYQDAVELLAAQEAADNTPKTETERSAVG